MVHYQKLLSFSSIIIIITLIVTVAAILAELSLRQPRTLSTRAQSSHSRQELCLHNEVDSRARIVQPPS